MVFAEFKLAKHKLDLLNELVNKGRKPKQGLKELDKWLKRDPNDVTLRLLRAMVLFECERYEESVSACNKLAKLEPRTTDVHIIENMQWLVCRLQKHENVVKLSAGADIVELWQNAVKSQKDGTDLLFQWYRISARCGHWEDVRVVLSSLRKAFPNKSKYFFHYIAATQIAADILSKDDPARSKLNGTLAFKFIETAAKQAVAQPGSRNSLASAEDLALLVYVYQKHGHLKELLKILDSDQIGVNSKLGLTDGQFINAKIEVLTRENMLLELRTFCESLLQDVADYTEKNRVNDPAVKETSADNWTVFAAFVGVIDYSDTKSITAAEKLTRSFLTRGNSEFLERNASLALVSLVDQKLKQATSGDTSRLMEQFTIGEETISADSLVDACAEYYSRFGSHNCCYDDLKDLVEKFTVDERAVFLKAIEEFAREGDRETMSAGEKIAPKRLSLYANALKFDYLFHISLDNESPLGKNLHAFLNKPFSVLKLAKTSRQDAVRDVYFLAVMALLKLAHAEKDQYQAQGYNLQAACLLSHYIKSCPDDRQASLFLTKIYSHMGLGSLVLRQYSALRIKEMMHDSQSHVAYSRISTTYPFPTHTFPSPEPAPKGTPVDPDPYVRIENVVSRYSDFVDDINQCLCDIEDLSFHDRMADFRELRESYERSFTKQLLALERRRIARLSDRPVDTRDFEDIDFWLTDLRDNRDFTCVPNYEQSSAPNFEECLWNGPKPDKYYLATSMLIEETFSLLTSTTSIHSLDREAAQIIVSGATASQQAELTSDEQALLPGWTLLRALVRRIVLGPAAEKNLDLSSSAQKLKAFLLSEIVGTTLPDTQPDVLPSREIIQRLFLHLTFLKACSKLCILTTSLLKQKAHEIKGKVKEDEIDSLAASVKEISEGIYGFVGKWKEILEGEYLDGLMNAMVGGEIRGLVEEIVDREEVEDCVRGCRDSAVAALEGVLKVKMI